MRPPRLHAAGGALSIPGLNFSERKTACQPPCKCSPDISDAEWQTRCDLAALYHVVHHLGWTDLINTHMSARVPGEPNHFLINNYGEMFDEITASSLVKMDMDGTC